MMSEHYALSLASGSGAVGRWSHGIAVAGGDNETAGRLIEIVAEALDGSSPFDEIESAISTDEELSDSKIRLAVVTQSGEGLDIMVRGSVQVRTELDELISSIQPIRQHLADVSALWIGLSDAPSTQAHPVMDLSLIHI